MVYKILSIILGGLFLVAGGFYCFERYSRNKLEQELNNQIAQLSQTVKETETAYSQLGVQVNKIKLENKELQNLIKQRDQEISALNQVVLHWKDLYFEIKDAHGSTTDGNGNPIPDDPKCAACLKDKRFKVEFNQSKDYMNISGYTLTNPAYAAINLKWIKDLELTIILTRDKKDKTYTLYLDTGTSDVVPTKLSLKVDPSIYSIKWYERLGVGAELGIGDGLMVGVRGYVQIFDNWLVGPSFVNCYNGKDYTKFFGANVGWFPFR